MDVARGETVNPYISGVITAGNRDTIIETLRKLNIEEVRVKIINITTWSIVGKDKTTKNIVYKTLIIG